MHDTEKLQKLLEVVRDEILPLTESEVARGNHAFGGAVVRPDTLTSVMVGSDNRTASPLFHGEMDTLNRFFKLPVRPNPADLIFLSTHDPCPMCIAAIAWAGFKEVWVLFGTSDVEDEVCMKLNAQMFKEVFGVDGVRPENAFFTKRSLKKAVAGSPDKDELQAIVDEIEKRYDALEVADFDYPEIDIPTTD